MDNKTLKKLLITLGILTIVFAGYYIYKQQDLVLNSSDEASVSYESLLFSTQVFIQRRQELSTTNLDISLFEDKSFNTLRSFSKPADEIATGRTDPFAEVQNF